MLKTAALRKTLFVVVGVFALLTPQETVASRQRVVPASYHHGLLCWAGAGPAPTPAGTTATSTSTTPLAVAVTTEPRTSYLHGSQFQHGASPTESTTPRTAAPGSMAHNRSHTAQRLGATATSLSVVPASYLHGLRCKRGAAAAATTGTATIANASRTVRPRRAVGRQRVELSYTHGVRCLNGRPSATTATAAAATAPAPAVRSGARADANVDGADPVLQSMYAAQRAQATATAPAPAVRSEAGADANADEADPVLQGMYAAQRAQERVATAPSTAAVQEQPRQQGVAEVQDPVLAEMYAAQRAQELAEQAAAARARMPTARAPAVAPTGTQTAVTPTVPPAQQVSHDFRAKPAATQAASAVSPGTVVVAARHDDAAELRRAVQERRAAQAAYEQLQAARDTETWQHPEPEPMPTPAAAPVAGVGTITAALGVTFAAALALGCAWVRTARAGKTSRRRSSVTFSLVIDGASNVSRSAAPTASFRQRKRCSSMGMGV